MYKFGLIKKTGVWNETTTRIGFDNYFEGYKPSQSSGVFGLVSSTDGNFWLLGEDDDYYFTKAKISEETLRNLLEKLKNNDFSDTNLFHMNSSLLTITLLNLDNQENVHIEFDKYWLQSLIEVLDIDNPIPTKVKRVLKVWEKSIVPDKINYPLMTPTEYVYATILEYPSLYAKEDFEVVKFKVFDHLFNVIGNGISDYETFKDSLSKKKDINIAKAKKLCTETLYYGYEDFTSRIINDEEYIFPKGEAKAFGILEEEKENYKNIKFWQEIPKNLESILEEFEEEKTHTKFNPYPNFQKEYSIIWKIPKVLENLDKEWKNELLWFYEKCIEAINQGCFKNYSEFPTGNEKKDKQRINEIQKYNKDKSFEKISKDYEVEFNGDWSDFLKRRWLKTKKEYLMFIDETKLLIK